MIHQNDFLVLPSILSADFGKFIEEASTVDIPEIKFLHIDVMDGHFVPNLTFGPQVVKSLKKNTRFNLDVHLMIDNVSDFIPQFARAGADIITVHQEATLHLHRNIHQIKELGILAGVSVNPATSIKSIEWILSEVDLVLIMTVNPGFGGQEFIPFSLKKIRELNDLKKRQNYKFVIEVDGGIDVNTAGDAVVAGANYLVAGSSIFSKINRSKAIYDIIDSIIEAKRKSSSIII